MRRTVVLNVVGLTPGLIGTHTPRIRALRDSGSCSPVRPAFPAVTCTAQSTYLTGRTPGHHGIVGNGWYDRDLAEVQFWKQSNRLVQGPKVWEVLRQRHPGFTCAKLFWWYNRYSTADYSITPRPIYPADGRKIFDVASWPAPLGPAVKQELGPFPFAGFWGPAAGVRTPQGPRDAATRWIAESARWIEEHHRPDLSLVYLPHLDYNLQRWGPSDARSYQDLREIDAIVGGLVDFLAAREVQVVLLSEYGITDVTRPVHLNRVFRERGWLTIKDELGLEVLDAGASQAFAVADHQVAHVYVSNPSLLEPVREVLLSTPGVGQVLGPEGLQAMGLAHARTGDLVAIATAEAWFTYYYWLDDARAPDFARCVDIHRKPGYDPVELFLDPALRVPQLSIAWRLLRKQLGFRMLMDVIPLDAGLIRGSHGRIPESVSDFPLLLVPGKGSLPVGPIPPTDVQGHLLRCIEEG